MDTQTLREQALGPRAAAREAAMTVRVGSGDLEARRRGVAEQVERAQAVMEARRILAHVRACGEQERRDAERALAATCLAEYGTVQAMARALVNEVLAFPDERLDATGRERLNALATLAVAVSTELTSGAYRRVETRRGGWSIHSPRRP